MEAWAKAEPAANKLGARPTARRRESFLVLAVAGLIVPAFLSLSVKLLAPHGQRLVSLPSVGVPAGDDRVTAIAWRPGPDGALIVGTQQGQIREVTRDGMVASLSSEPGAIVALAPDRHGAITRIITRSGLGSANAPLLYRMGANPSGPEQGLSFANAVLALQLGADPGQGIDFEVVLGLKAALEKAAGATISAAVAFPDDGSLEGVASGDPRQGLSPEPATLPGGSRRVAIGFADGQVQVLRAPVFGSTSVVAQAVQGGPVLALAVETAPTGSALVAAAHADGSARLITARAEDGSVKLSARDVGMPCRQTALDPVLGTPAARPAHLFLSWASGILVSHCSDGGVVVTRFPTSVQEGAVTSQRWPLSDLIADQPPLAPSGGVVMDVQRALAAAGFETGNVDGIAGPRTSKAFDEFRQARALDRASESKALDALLGASWRVSAVAFSPAGDVLAAAGNDGLVRIATLSPTLGRTFLVSGHSDTVTHLEISPDGRALASVGLDGRVWITDLEAARRRSGLLFYELPTGPARVEPKPVPLERDERPEADGPQSSDSQKAGQQEVGSPAAEGDFVAVFGGDTTLAAAQDEVSRAARAGILGAQIVLRNGSYRSIVRYADQQARDRSLARLRTLSVWSSNAYGRNAFSVWCPSPVRLDGYLKCGRVTVRPAREN